MSTSLGVRMRCIAAALLLGAQAQAQPLPAQPTRLQLCQHEIGHAAQQRASRLRACLNRRLAGERQVTRDCRRQAESVPAGAARSRAQQDCERRTLALPSDPLQKQPAVKPAPPQVARAGASAVSRPSDKASGTAAQPTAAASKRVG